jgi:peptidoglycan hydrolase-like protein with peptidoglycan-binding domain
MNKKLALRAGLCAVALGGLMALGTPAQASPDVGNISSNHTGVKCAQWDLYVNGYYTGKVDGLYGSGTVAGVERLQRSLGLPDDGIVGKDTGGEILADIKDYFGNYKLGSINCYDYVPSHF